MAEQSQAQKPQNQSNTQAQKKLQGYMGRFPHLRKYINEIEHEMPIPKFHTKLDKSMRDVKNPNIIYPVKEPVFIHIFRGPDDELEYHIVQPELTEEEKETYSEIQDKLIEIAHSRPVPDGREARADILINLLRETVEITENPKPLGFLSKLTGGNKFQLTQRQFEKIKYHLIRDRLGYGKLDGILKDPYIEDIHGKGLGNVFLQHKVFGMMKTSIEFDDDESVDQYLFDMADKAERPISDARPIVDAIMPDGSRASFVYSRNISLEGSSFTIRKFSEVPLSIVQLINFGTLSPGIASYMWLAIEYGSSFFVCGETASGKTTTLNALTAFIEPEGKVYSVENVPEITVPHDVWQHLVTREAGKETDVTMQDLLFTALRSRPEYIIVGEIRGEEGSIAFQAMQTGHPVCSTFHAGSVGQMIERLNGDPINIPMPFMDNLNVVMIQARTMVAGNMERRVTSVTELQKYVKEEHSVLTKKVFDWNVESDEHFFRGWYNSYVLEDVVAPIMGYGNRKKIYDDFQERKKVMEKMVEHKIFNYFDVWQVITRYIKNGELPFRI